MVAGDVSRSGGNKTVKAVGTRDRVVAWLADHGEVRDQAGMASTTLARAVGYPGSSIAFAQLLFGMERAGLIAREIRGKRTYRVTLTETGRRRASETARRQRVGERARSWVPGSASTTSRGRRPGAGEEVDYDELARTLLIQAARRLAVTGEGWIGTPRHTPAKTTAATKAATTAEVDGAGASRAPSTSSPSAGAGGAGTAERLQALEERMVALETELARARAVRLDLQAENDELRDKLRRVRGSLPPGTPRRPRRQRTGAGGSQLGRKELALLQLMLDERQRQSRSHNEADTA